MNFVLITPVYNEQKYLAETIEGVLAQSLLPQRWILVDDGSTDSSPQIIQDYAARIPWIRYHARKREAGQSYYSSNVYAIMEGYELVRKDSFDFLAILDADISLPSHYYETLFQKFEEDSKLGVASGVYLDLIDGRLQKVLNDRRSTPKALQVFRRACFEQIGGYLPLRYGGEDTCSCFMARMHGWKTWSFPELEVVHRKPAGMGHSQSRVKARFRQGLNEYGLGTHPLFLLLKSLRRCLLERPFLLAGLARITGYAYGWIKREPRQVPNEVVQFIRAEQKARIFKMNQIPDSNRMNRIESSSQE